LATGECLACHNDPSLAKDENGKPVSLYVDADRFKASTHGSVMQCRDCHPDVRAFPHEPASAKVRCAACHAGQQTQYANSSHAKAIAAGNPKAATCTDCHGGPHELLAAGDPNSKVNRANIPKTCSACHGLKLVMEASGFSERTAFSYQESVHGRALASGNTKAAVCSDCHGEHEILSASDPKSPVFKFRIPQTCGQCHSKATTEFMASTHGQAIGRGNWLAPVCTDCHGIHLISAPLQANSSAAAQQLQSTCGRCHESVRLTQEFGILGFRSATYLSSYHGLAAEGGSNLAANCASCHGVHNILPSSNPKSTINPANLPRTSGKCHVGATENFGKGKVHLAVGAADTGSVAVRYISRLYLWIIALTVGSMLLHNFLAWRKKAIAARRARNRTVIRMEGVQRYQHLVLLSSFSVLALTGFALKYPLSWFAQALLVKAHALGVLHRAAGALLIGASLFHAGYIMLTRGGRRLFADMMPTVRDGADIIGTLRYYLGVSEDRPVYGRFHYGQKVEYLALLWGMLVMALTGLAMWFSITVTHFAPRWVLDVRPRPSFLRGNPGCPSHPRMALLRSHLRS
jgi:cytochrome b subunit of formate dehydrogenase